MCKKEKNAKKNMTHFEGTYLSEEQVVYYPREFPQQNKLISVQELLNYECKCANSSFFVAVKYVVVCCVHALAILCLDKPSSPAPNIEYTNWKEALSRFG